MPDMTSLLFQTDAYARSCEATVVEHDESVHAIILDRTVFYPAGGGQPADRGQLRAGGRKDTLPVIDATKHPAGVAHVIDPSFSLPPVGAQLVAEIDWDRRYRLMRTHTALHVLCGVVFRDFTALVTGGNMDIDKARMDFELEDLSPEKVEAIEQAANQEIAAGREIRIAFLPREQAFLIPDLIRTKINLLPEGISTIRTVEIVGLDLQADGGTHVANTHEVIGLKVIGTRSKGRINKRLEIALVDK